MVIRAPESPANFTFMRTMENYVFDEPDIRIDRKQVVIHFLDRRSVEV